MESKQHSATTRCIVSLTREDRGKDREEIMHRVFMNN